MFVSFSSCTITTTIPNVIKGVWARYKEADVIDNVYTIDHRLTLVEGNIYTHEIIDQDQGTVTYNGLYEMYYTTFSPTYATGVVTLDGATESGDRTEKRSFYFVWKATAEQGPRELILTDVDINVDLELKYNGAS